MGCLQRAEGLLPAGRLPLRRPHSIFPAAWSSSSSLLLDRKPSAGGEAKAGGLRERRGGARPGKQLHSMGGRQQAIDPRQAAPAAGAAHRTRRPRSCPLRPRRASPPLPAPPRPRAAQTAPHNPSPAAAGSEASLDSATDQPTPKAVCRRHGLRGGVQRLCGLHSCSLHQPCAKQTADWPEGEQPAAAVPRCGRFALHSSSGSSETSAQHGAEARAQDQSTGRKTASMAGSSTHPSQRKQQQTFFW